MPASAPSVRFLAPSLIVRGVDTVITVDIERDGASLTFGASPQLSVYDDTGSEVGSARSMTQAGATLSATISASDTTGKDFSGQYQIAIAYTVTGEQARTAYNAAALCLADLSPPVGVSDLAARYALLSRLQENGGVSLQGHISQAWGELLTQLYQDEAPFWQIRSSSALRPWLLHRALEIALRDAALPLAPGNPYTTEADRLAALTDTTSETGLYRRLQVRLDPGDENILEARSSPVVDTRRSG